MKVTLIVFFLLGLSLTSFGQEKKVEAKPAKHIVTTKKKKITHIYLILYKNKDGSHRKKPKKVYQYEGETFENVKKRADISEKGEEFIINEKKVISADAPFGLLCSYKKKGKTYYQFASYKTYKKAQYWYEDNTRFNKTCDEIITL